MSHYQRISVCLEGDPELKSIASLDLVRTKKENNSNLYNYMNINKVEDRAKKNRRQ